MFTPTIRVDLCRRTCYNLGHQRGNQRKIARLELNLGQTKETIDMNEEKIAELKRLLRRCNDRPVASCYSEGMEAASQERRRIRIMIRERIKELSSKIK